MITDNFTHEQIERAFATLPEGVRAVLLATETGDALIRIGKTHNLHIDQTASLEDVTTLTLCGLIPRERFTATITSELHITHEQALAITEQVNTDIFSRIRTSLESQTATNNIDTSSSDIPKEASLDEYIPSRDDILKEIETPTPTPDMVRIPITKEPLSPATTPEVTPVVRSESLPVETPLHDVMLVPPKPAVPQSSTPSVPILDKRLSEEIHTPIEKTSLPPTPPTTPPRIDPYREPMM